MVARLEPCLRWPGIERGVWEPFDHAFPGTFGLFTFDRALCPGASWNPLFLVRYQEQCRTSMA